MCSENLQESSNNFGNQCDNFNNIKEKIDMLMRKQWIINYTNVENSCEFEKDEIKIKSSAKLNEEN
jgi:hypothetical protein